MPEILPAEEPSPFDVFESTTELAAFVFAKYGADGLRQVLEASGQDRESLESDATELEEVGLGKVAAIVLAVAANKPSSEDRCPYEPGSTNARAWYASRARQPRQRIRARNHKSRMVSAACRRSA